MLRLLAASALVAAVLAQSSGWESGQINATMCSWEQPRVAVVKDTVYIDGGLLYWIPGKDDGSYDTPAPDDNPLGIIWTLNFSTPFSTVDNITALMKPLYKVNPDSNANNLAPNFYDGALLANDDEFFLYGGLLDQTDAYSYPDGDVISAYRVDQYGAYKAAFRPGIINADLPDNMTRYVAYGGAASAPSENKAWYFSGLRSPSWGPIYNVNGNDSLTAVNISNTLISVDMTTQQEESWTNKTLDSTIDGRANPELVWVPVGPQGILVAIGGVTYPEFISVMGKSTNSAASKSESPAFVTTVDVYDIANKLWYKQPTTGGSAMGQRTRACSVLATADDASSFNIYYYGGFDGLDVSSDFNDDVWVLSLPSFTWTKVYASKDSTHGRAGHKCVKPYPDQMFVVGGYPPISGSSLSCLGGGIVQLFNLSSAAWMDAYTPTEWSEYSVPDAVVKVIGGDGKGESDATYDTHSNAVFRWLRAQPSVKHASTEGTSWDGDGPNGFSTSGAPHSTGTPISPEMAELNLARGSPGYHQQSYGQSPHGQPALHGNSNNNIVSELTADNAFASELSADATQTFELPADFPGSNVSSTDISGNTNIGSAQGYFAKSVSAELESPLQNSVLNSSNNGSARNLTAQGIIPRADSPSLGSAPPFSPSPPQPTPPFAATPSMTAGANFRESNISDISEQDRSHLRHGSEGGQSVASGVSSSAAGTVSPLGSDFPPTIIGVIAASSTPQPIPEAAAGAEAAAEEEAAKEQGQATASAAARTGAPEQASPTADASPSQSRRSVFRESEADLKE
ncbi:kelch repeat protein [Ophiostoma piceae UAMH 11346]|uniref:Kelch repeat protein n=1 Tax=Ophiostoma piceae (strain UAMH 11346) TaxID=1262450 RepID=S3C2U3_OPHP1|nr:kelch repeat protein [Ophiostoma piceae UAMH 11346]